MITKKIAQRACELLNKMEEDEKKAIKDYNELMDLLPEKAGKLNSILGDEIKHDVKIEKIRREMMCR